MTGDDEDNLVICQMAKHHFDVPRTIARVNNPKNEELFRHLGVDEIISPTRMALGSIEQDIPVHELLHLAQLEGGELEIIEAQLQAELAGHRQDRARTSACPTAARCSCSSATASPTPLRPDTVLAEGDKVIAIGRPTARSCSTSSSSGTPPRPDGSTAAGPALAVQGLSDSGQVLLDAARPTRPPTPWHAVRDGELDPGG